MSECVEIRVPEFGHGLTDALVVEWLVSVGDTVERGDTVAVLETDKSSVDLMAESAGTVAEIVVGARTITTSGSILYKLDPTTVNRGNPMASNDERANDHILKIMRRRMPSAELSDFGKATWDLDLDSLDLAELTEMLEREFEVEADLEKLDDCTTPADIKAYFLGLAR